MDDTKKTKAQLIEELKKIRLKVSHLEKSKAKLKIAEESLKDEAIRRRILVEQSSDGIVVLDENGNVYEANLKYAQMLGYTMEEVYRLHIWDWDNDYAKEQLLEMLRTIDEKGDHFETKHRRKDGTIFDVEISTNGAFCGGKKLIFAVCRDISDRKQAEQEKLKLEEQLHHAQKLEAIGTLTGGIAHDFNNILGIILGFAEISIEQIPKDSPVHGRLNHIVAACYRAKDIILQLRTFSRKVTIEKRPIDPVQTIKEALKFLRSSLPSTIEIRQNFSAVSGIIMADPTQLHQVMMNLCTNAAQAMEKTYGVISVDAESIVVNEARPEKKLGLLEGDYFKLTISDTGSGIEPEIIDRIFDPYFTTKEFGKGTGMGLSLVHGIIKNHSGVISVVSKPGEGAVFTIFLPMIKNKNVDTKQFDDALPRGKETILFVDDEPEITTIAEKNLQNLGYTVKTALSPIDALILFRKDPHQYHLIITDMIMPHLTGEAFFKEIRTIRKDIPAIICTGFSTLIDEQRAKEIGFAAYLMKPISRYELSQIVRAVIDNSQ
jgi:PAS domain S-box-containing protein